MYPFVRIKTFWNKVKSEGLRRSHKPQWHWMLVLVSLWLAACAAGPAPSPTPTVTPTSAPQDIVLTMGAWRTSTQKLNRVLNEFSKVEPHITVQLDPSLSGEYDKVLAAQLDSGTAPDLFFLRSFSTSRKLFEQGYVVALEDLPGLRENFEAHRLVPWSTEEGIPYGVPFAATSHGIYYNQDIFEAADVSVPENWEALLETAAALEQAGYIPFANATKEDWPIAEIMFMNVVPNFIGGREGRLAYLNGKRCFNDAHVVAAFQAMQDLVPYLPEDHALLGYIDSLQLFLQGKAALWMSGSWDIPYLEEANPDFTWSVFAIPPPAGQPSYVTFQPDVAIGLNAASKYPAEARAFLTWLITPEFARLIGNEMPGFFPMHRDIPTLDNAHANAFLALNQGRDTDIRFAWEKLGTGTPDGYTLMLEGARAVIEGRQTPQQAADTLQVGLAEWFEPAQTCTP